LANKACQRAVLRAVLLMQKSFYKFLFMYQNYLPDAIADTTSASMLNYWKYLSLASCLSACYTSYKITTLQDYNLLNRCS